MKKVLLITVALVSLACVSFLAGLTVSRWKTQKPGFAVRAEEGYRHKVKAFEVAMNDIKRIEIVAVFLDPQDDTRTLRVGPIIVNDNTVIREIASEIERVNGLQWCAHPFATYTCVEEFEFTFVCDTNSDFRARLVCSNQIHLGRDERLEGQLPSSQLMDQIVAIASNWGKMHPEDVESY